MQTAKLSSRLARLALLAALNACANERTEPEPKTCDAACRDESAVRSLRETIKVVYNLTLQANDVGEQDETARCPLGGSARVTGRAGSLAEQGATELELIYELTDCAYLQRDDEPEENYDMVISGSITEQGILAVQPTATTALIFESSSISLRGTVYDPPADYSEVDCALRLAQNGNAFSGTFCGRKIGFDL
jgi:hypothetical protein